MFESGRLLPPESNAIVSKKRLVRFPCCEIRERRATVERQNRSRGQEPQKRLLCGAAEDNASLFIDSLSPRLRRSAMAMITQSECYPNIRVGKIGHSANQGIDFLLD